MKKILVVDDEVDILAVVKLILTEYNFEVETVSRWELVPDAITNFRPDLVLLDVCLSGADGREICNQIKDRENTAHIPVVLFSANYNLLQSVKDCKADAVLNKPFDVNDLLSIINEKVI